MIETQCCSFSASHGGRSDEMRRMIYSRAHASRLRGSHTKNLPAICQETTDISFQFGDPDSFYQRAFYEKPHSMPLNEQRHKHGLSSFMTLRFVCWSKPRPRRLGAQVQRSSYVDVVCNLTAIISTSDLNFADSIERGPVSVRHPMLVSEIPEINASFN